MDIFGTIGSLIMTPLYYLVSGILLSWHWLFDHIAGISDGWVWVLSIMGLTVTIRAMLIPLFVKQIKSSRNMQLLAPQLKELQKKYGHDRERMAQEQMKLYKETGTNPLASCLPLIAQMPVFFALFRVIDQAAKAKGDLTSGVRGFFDVQDVASLQNAEVLGARIADTFVNGEGTGTRILTIVLVLAMVATQFLTQRQLMAKNMPESALSGPYAQQQKLLLYVLPPVFALGGFFFPLGVLFYWTTSNLWTMGQQFYVIRNNPVPGTPAFKAKQERERRKGQPVSVDPIAEAAAAAEAEKQRQAARQQPRNQPRSQRKKKSGGAGGKEKRS